MPLNPQIKGRHQLKVRPEETNRAGYTALPRDLGLARGPPLKYSVVKYSVGGGSPKPSWARQSAIPSIEPRHFKPHHFKRMMSSFTSHDQPCTVARSDRRLSRG